MLRIEWLLESGAWTTWRRRPAATVTRYTGSCGFSPPRVFLARPRHRYFELTGLGAALRSDDPSSPRDLIRMMNREPYLTFSQLGHSVHTGLPAFDKVFGKPRFDWLADHADAAALFQQAMIALSQGANEAVAKAYDFGPFGRLVDVGGGHGQGSCRKSLSDVRTSPASCSICRPVFRWRGLAWGIFRRIPSSRLEAFSTLFRLARTPTF